MPYKKHFDLKEIPFSTHPDPRFFYLTDQHQTAMDKNQFTAQNKLGLGVTYGSPGTGKTSLSRILFQRFADQQDFETVLLADPQYKTDNRMLRAIIQEFDVGETQKAMADSMQIFSSFLEKKVADEGKTCLLIVDHGERMKEELYALISDLLELKDRDEKGLLQVLVFGRHEMRDKLRDPRSKNLAERIAIESALEPLTYDDMVKKIEFRFHIAGLKEQPFSQDALRELYVRSKGVPRVVNRLADKALYEAMMRDGDQVWAEDIVRAEKVMGMSHLEMSLQNGEKPLTPKKGKRGRPPQGPKRKPGRPKKNS
ncbi:MAG TPA: AAA family ATPase [bacterium]|nr:AAA family ATPase [bacterium]